MPGQDGTGPAGYGPRSGRGLGPCGRGFRRGFGRCWAPYTYYQPTKEEEVKVLEAEKAEIEARLKELKENK